MLPYIASNVIKKILSLCTLYIVVVIIVSTMYQKIKLIQIEINLDRFLTSKDTLYLNDKIVC